MWGLIFSAIGFLGWFFFSFLFAVGKITGSGTAVGIFFVTTFGIIAFFSLPIGAVFDFSRRFRKLKYAAYALIMLGILCWAGVLVAGIREQSAYKPIKIRAVNIVKEGPNYSDRFFVSVLPPPSAQYGEFKLDVTVSYLRLGSERAVVTNIYTMTENFELKNIEPQLPYQIGDTATFTLTIKGPSEGFDGPLTLKIKFAIAVP